MNLSCKVCSAVTFYEGEFRLSFCGIHGFWDNVSEYVRGYYRNGYISCDCQVFLCVVIAAVAVAVTVLFSKYS